MKTISVSDLHLNDGSYGLPKNPRFIRDARFKALVESIREFPEAMPARGIVTDERGVILGGNMRFRACLELKMKTVPAEMVACQNQQRKCRSVELSPGNCAVILQRMPDGYLRPEECDMNALSLPERD